MLITFYSHSVKHCNYALISGRRYLSVKITKTSTPLSSHFCRFDGYNATDKNLGGPLHSTSAKKPEETITTVVQLQNYIKKITKATKLLWFYCTPLHN